jgi:hypothetical protein
MISSFVLSRSSSDGENNTAGLMLRALHIYADYAASGRYARAAGGNERELEGKIEDGDIVFTLYGFMDEEGNFSLSAGSNVLIYQITGKLMDGELSDTQVIIRIKTGGTWTEYTEVVISAGDVSITEPDSPGQLPKDKNVLGAAIGAAKTAKDGVVVSVNGGGLFSTVYWVTSGQLSAFTGAISAAEAVYDDAGANQEAVDAAVTALQTALGTFNSQKQPGLKVLYIAGIYVQNGSPKAAYWKGAVRYELPSGGMPGIRGFAFVGSDMYIAGFDDSGPCYWKNGIRCSLPIASGGSGGSAQSITVLGSDVYIAGHYYTSGACYWKNGVRTDLGAAFSFAWDIEVSGSDVYIAGDVDNHACYWKNGTKFDLPDGGANFSYAHAAAVSGSDLYITGVYYNGSIVACYWKNGIKYDLSGNYAAALAVLGGDIYILGAYESGGLYKPCYWKNGARTALSVPGPANGHASAIAFDGGDVYITGDCDEDGSMNYKPWFWKNGVKTELPAELIMAEAVAIK